VQDLVPTPEKDRKALARVVALARYDLERERLGETTRTAFLASRLQAAEAALADHDRQYPAVALSVLLADGPGYNEPLYLQRREELESRLVARGIEIPRAAPKRRKSARLGF
jgi:hypothetical protein